MFFEIWNRLKSEILDLRDCLKFMTGTFRFLVLGHLSARSRHLLLAFSLSISRKLRISRLLFSGNLCSFLIHHTHCSPCRVVRNNFSEGSISQLHIREDIHWQGMIYLRLTLLITTELLIYILINLLFCVRLRIFTRFIVTCN